MKKKSGIKFKGVYEQKGVFSGKKNYIARINIGGLLINLGSFRTKTEAAIAYDKAAIKLGRRTNLLSTKPAA